MKTVRLRSMQFEGKEIPLIAHDKGDENDNHISVIIGKNAAGKSRILASALNKMRLTTNRRLKDKGETQYLWLKLDQSHFMISGKSYIPLDFDKINLVSISNSLYDKFPHQAKSDKNYTYVGQRMVGLSTHRRSIINEVIDVLNDQINNSEYKAKALKLTEFIEIEPFIKISLRKGPGLDRQSSKSELLFDKNLDLKKYLLKLAKEGFYRNQARYLEDAAKNDRFLSGLKNYIQTEIAELTKSAEKKTIDYIIDFRGANESNSFIEDYEYFSMLRRLNLLTYESVTVRKGIIDFDILESSTGQIGLLTTFLRALPHLKDNSLIFIDEPEISLHPSWQMQYIDLLRTFLNDFYGCHVLIASHSHFLLSDLNPKWSSVVTLEAKDESIHGEVLEYSPYSWSPEAILYNVFGVTGVRNHYFENDVRTLLELISENSKNKSRIQSLIRKLEEFKLPPGDPLKGILNDAHNYLESIRK